MGLTELKSRCPQGYAPLRRFKKSMVSCCFLGRLLSLARAAFLKAINSQVFLTSPHWDTGSYSPSSPFKYS